MANDIAKGGEGVGKSVMIGVNLMMIIVDHP